MDYNDDHPGYNRSISKFNAAEIRVIKKARAYFPNTPQLIEEALVYADSTRILNSLQNRIQSGNTNARPISIRIILSNLVYWSTRPDYAGFIKSLMKKDVSLSDTFHTAIQMGSVIIHWFDFSLVFIKTFDEGEVMLGLEVGEILPQDMNEKLDEVSREIVRWNTTKKFQSHGCQSFVNAILKVLKIDIPRDAGAIGDFFAYLKRNKKLSVRLRDKKFTSHQQLDKYVRELEDHTPPLLILPDELAVLKSFDRAFWFRHKGQHHIDKALWNPSFLPDSPYCPFYDPQGEYNATISDDTSKIRGEAGCRMSMLPKMIKTGSRPVKVLSLSSAFSREEILIDALALIEKKLQKPIKDCFDLIVVSSTSAFLAFAIAQGKSFSEMKEMVVELRRKVYGDMYGLLDENEVSHYKRNYGLFDQEVLRDSFDSVASTLTWTSEFDTRGGPRIIVVASTLENQKYIPFVFSFGGDTLNGHISDFSSHRSTTRGTPSAFLAPETGPSTHSPTEYYEKQDLDIKIPSVLVAACAAPHYFPSVKIWDRRFEDAYLSGTSNPAEVGLSEALDLYPKNPIIMVSVAGIVEFENIHAVSVSQNVLPTLRLDSERSAALLKFSEQMSKDSAIHSLIKNWLKRNQIPTSRIAFHTLTPVLVASSPQSVNDPDTKVYVLNTLSSYICSLIASTNKR